MPIARLGPRFTVAVRYGGAILAAALALATWQLGGRELSPTPEPLFLAAVVIAAWLWGIGPGLLVTLTGTLAVLAGAPVLSFLSSPHLSARVTIFLLAGACLAWLASSYGHARRRGRRTAERLQRQLGLMEAITTSMGEGVYAVDGRGNTTLINPAAERLLGWRRDEVIGQPMHAIVHVAGRGDSNHEAMCPLIAGLQRGETCQCDDDTFTRKDGTPISVSYTFAPMTDGEQVIGGVVSFADITERRRAEAERADLAAREHDARTRAASAAAQRAVVLASPLPIIALETDGRVRSWNAAAERTFGWTEAEVLSQPLPFVPSDRWQEIERLRARVLRGESLVGVEMSVLRKDGTAVDVILSTAALQDSKGYVSGIMYAVVDISERKRAEEALRRSEGRLAMQYAATKVLAQSANLEVAMPRLLQAVCERAGWDVGQYWILESDEVLRCHSRWNSPSVDLTAFLSLSRRLSCPPGYELPGRAWEAGHPLWIADLSAEIHLPRALTAVRAGLQSAFCFPVIIDTRVHGVIEVYSQDIRRPSEDLVQALTTIGTQVGLFVERKTAEEALEYQALHDGLTDLPNRTLLQDRLQQAILAAHRSGGAVALLLMDLDRFKEVNDTFGHHYGDLLLQQVGHRLQGALRVSDTVSRLGGDEFAVLLPDVDQVGAVQTAEKILEALSEPFALDDQRVAVGASIGMALYPNHGEDASLLMQRADVAMYVAKRGNHGHSIYAADQDENSAARLTWISELRDAIDEEQLLLYFQPQIDLRSRDTPSVEALVRWQHPQRGLVLPDRFITLSEETGLIKALSYQVLNAAIRQCRSWRDMGLELRVAVNLSASSLHDAQLAQTVADLLRRWEVDPECIEIEITETAIMVDPLRALEVLSRVSDMGISIAIDDFGTGYSSLAYLQRLPVSGLKIDKSFVLDMARNDDDAFIARSIVDLGHRLGLQVVAEGVQDEQTCSLLGAMGCDLAQGFYLSRPMPADSLTAWLQADTERSVG